MSKIWDALTGVRAETRTIEVAPIGSPRSSAELPRLKRRHPDWPYMLLVVAVVVLLPFITDNEYYATVLILCGLWSFHAVGQTVLLGGSGELNLAYGAVFGVGAYMAANLLGFDWPFGLVLILAGLAGGLITAAFGFPLLKTRGLFYAVMTMAVGLLAAKIFIEWTAVTGGSVGLPVPMVDLSFIPLLGDVNPGRLSIAYLVWALVLLGLVFAQRLLASPFGLILRGIGGDEPLVAALGYRAGHYRLLALSLTGVYAGIAGVLFAVNIGYVTNGPFSFWTAFTVIIMVIVGGRESVWGSVIAASFLTALPEVLRSVQSYRMIVYAMVLYIVVVIRANKVAGGIEH